MRLIRLDMTHIDTPRAAQIYLQYMLCLPDHYGRNLDALHDVLCEADEPMHISLALPVQMRGEMAAYLPRLIQVFEDAARENAMLEMGIFTA